CFHYSLLPNKTGENTESAEEKPIQRDERADHDARTRYRGCSCRICWMRLKPFQQYGSDHDCGHDPKNTFERSRPQNSPNFTDFGRPRILLDCSRLTVGKSMTVAGTLAGHGSLQLFKTPCSGSPCRLNAGTTLE